MSCYHTTQEWKPSWLLRIGDPSKLKSLSAGQHMTEVKTYPTWDNRPQLLQSWPWLSTLRDLQRLNSSQIRTQLASSVHSYDWGDILA